MDEEAKDALREKFGLKGSFGERYINWLKRVLHGDLGNSIRYNGPVWNEMKPRMVKTTYLAVTAFLMMLCIAVPLGSVSALYEKKWLDYVIRFLSFVGAAFPGFWLGMLLLYWLGYKFKVISILSTGRAEDVILPALTLAFPLACRYIRIIRTQILEELGQEYVMAERCRGVSWVRILLCHVMPNAFLTLVTALGMSFGNLFGGTAVIESIFNWQGVGYMAVNSVQDRDYNMIQGYTLWIGMLYIGLNLIVDIFSMAVDPRRAGRLKSEEIE